MIVRAGLIARTWVCAVGVAAFMAVGCLWLIGGQSVYEHLLTLWGIAPFRYPFVDIDGSLAAWECARIDVNVIVANPCDVLQRGYNYSPFWMTISWIPLDRQDRLAAGLILGFCFLVSLSGLPAPLSRGEAISQVFAVLSTMVAFAIDRANPDLLIFILVVVSLPLLRRSAVARGCAYGLVFLAGAIKYYPFVLLALAVRERRRFFLAVTLLSAIGLVCFWYVYAAQILEGLPGIASGIPYGDMFGAKNLPVGLFGILDKWSLSADAAGKISALVTLGLLATIVIAMTRLSQNGRVIAALSELDEARRLALLAGALLIAGCFIAGQNVGYRGIFLLLVLPGIFALGRGGPTAVAWLARLAAVVIPVLMWAEAIRCWIHLAAAGEYPPPGFVSVFDEPADLIAWCAREIMWWVTVGFLVTIILNFVVYRLSVLLDWRQKRFSVTEI